MNLKERILGPPKPPPSLQSERFKRGTQLIRFAWSVEIIAALIGFTIAIGRLFETLNAEENVSQLSSWIWFSAFLAALPWVIVGLVELTKVPLATAAYLSANRRSKYIFGFGLILLVLITTETMLNGFERNYARLTASIETQNQKLREVTARLENEETEVANLETKTEQDIRKDNQTQKDLLRQDRDRDIESLNQRILDVKARHGQGNLRMLMADLTNVAEQITRQEENKQRDLGALRDRHKQDRELAPDFVREQRSNIQQQLDRAVDPSVLEQRRSRLEDDIATEKQNHGVALNELDNEETQELAARKELATEKLVGINVKLSTLEAELETLQKGAPQSEDTKAEIKDKNGRRKILTTRLRAHVDSKEDQLKGAFLTRTGREEKWQRYYDDLVVDIEKLTADIAELQSKQDSTSAKLAESKRSEYRRLTEESKKYDVSKIRSEIRLFYDDKRSKEKDRYKQEIAALEGNLKETEDELIGVQTAHSQQDAELLGQLSALTVPSRLKELDETFKEDQNEIVELYGVTLTNLDKKHTGLSTQIQSYEDSQSDLLDEPLARLEEERVDLMADYKSRADNLEDSLTKKLKRLDDRQERIDTLSDNIVTNQDKEIVIRSKIADLTRQSQPHRIAALFLNKEESMEADADRVNLVAIVWFGSLAIIVAWTGTLLAFGGLVLRYGPTQRTPGKLSRSMRSYFVDRRRRGRRTVVQEIEREIIKEVLVEKIVPTEVAKEIPVEKVVIQTVEKDVPVDKVVFKEVPKEVVRKELVYVPVFTDDPQLKAEKINKSDDEDNDKEKDR